MSEELFMKRTRFRLVLMREQVWRCFNHECFYCGISLTLDNWTMDHFKPRKRGGSDKIENLVISCRTCNEAKGCRMPTSEERKKHIELLTSEGF